MPRLDFHEIEQATGVSADRDQFEKFAKVFFESVIKAEVVKGPSRGPDGGIDLKLEVRQNGQTVKKLVSCKHYAHSNNSVGINDEIDIYDRLEGFGCKVFVGFYSTLASAALEQKLERLRAEKGIEFEFFNSEDIETHLLGSHAGFMLAKRFFPRSVQNLWPQVIALKQAYTLEDVVQIESKWIVPSAFSALDRQVFAYDRDSAVQVANEKAMRDIHAPMFLAAWKDAATYYPNFFDVPLEGIEGAESVAALPPKWSAAERLSDLKPNERWSLLAIWSLIDVPKVREIMIEMNRDASQQELDLLSFQWLAFSTATNRRDILTRLFAYYLP